MPPPTASNWPFWLRVASKGLIAHQSIVDGNDLSSMATTKTQPIYHILLNFVHFSIYWALRGKSWHGNCVHIIELQRSMPPPKGSLEQQIDGHLSQLSDQLAR
jgi:hypothetical protein